MGIVENSRRRFLKKIFLKTHDHLTFLFRSFLVWVFPHCSVADISAFVHLGQQLESSLGEEWSRKPDTGSGVSFATVSILLTFVLVREVKNLGDNSLVDYCLPALQSHSSGVAVPLLPLG